MGRHAELQRKNLEHLMGPEAMGIIQVDLKFTDLKVCRSMLAGTCPHDLFVNTKMDLGACPKTHSHKLKAEYEASLAHSQSDNPEERSQTVSSHELTAIRKEYEQNISSFVDECDRRIRAAQKRLEKTPEENNRTTALMREIGEIQTAYEAAMAEVESLGESGKVDESMAELAKAEALKAEKQEKERELQQLTETSGASGHQKLRVCDICGAYLSILDSDRRLADHFGGKMHLGYLQLRQSIDEWRKRPPAASQSSANAGFSSQNGTSQVPQRQWGRPNGGASQPPSSSAAAPATPGSNGPPAGPRGGTAHTALPTGTGATNGAALGRDTPDRDSRHRDADRHRDGERQHSSRDERDRGRREEGEYEAPPPTSRHHGRRDHDDRRASHRRDDGDKEDKRRHDASRDDDREKRRRFD